MHNNTNYHGWNKALTFGVGLIQLSFHTIVFTQYMQKKMFSIQMLLHFSQIVQRVCTLVLFIRPSIEYGSEVWEGNKSQAGSLKSIILNGAKRILGF